ncbi:hypothetical protein AGMMS50229_03410 [Campylobacterota bacterium]|nr:hypothetical protein AGMMS50229_03410 [Campylobacterota bacterium]
MCLRNFDDILSVGISLEHLGIKNWALSQFETLKALDRFESMQIPILGGDVCELRNGRIEYNYDNWYCNRLANEFNLNYITRSIDKAREYVKKYPIREYDKIFFVLTPDRDNAGHTQW